MNDLDIIIICGGFGQRISALTKKHQCKSLIPIIGSPAIEYVIRVVRSVTDARIILCVDREDIVPSFENIKEQLCDSNIDIYRDHGRGPMPAMYEVSGRCSKNKVLVLFGHHLLTPTHLKRMLQYHETPILTLFQTSSESHCKIAGIAGNHGCVYVERHTYLKSLAPNERYIDLPYLLPISFFNDTMYPTLKRLFIKGVYRRALLTPDEKVYGIEADFPHEFHAIEDLALVEKFASNLIRNNVLFSDER